MVDTQDAVIAHVGAQHIDEDLIAAAFQALRMQRRQAPVLPGGTEFVRRRTDRDLQAVHIAVHPGIRPAARDADGKITIEAENHALFTAVMTQVVELIGQKPLQPHVITDVRLMRSGKSENCGTIGIAVSLRPAQPANTVFTKRHGSILRIEVVIQRFKGAVETQLAPLFFDELGKSFACGGKDRVIAITEVAEDEI